MAIAEETRRINVLVAKVFGSEFRADWRVSKGKDESAFERMFGRNRIMLERSYSPDVVAGFSPWLPSIISEPRIVAKMSSDGERIIISEAYKNKFGIYSREYFSSFGKAPKIISLSNSFFLDSIRNYGSISLNGFQH